MLVYFPSYIFYFGLIIICESAEIKAVRGPKAVKQFLPTYHNLNRRIKDRSFTSRQPINAGNYHTRGSCSLRCPETQACLLIMESRRRSGFTVSAKILVLTAQPGELRNFDLHYIAIGYSIT